MGSLPYRDDSGDFNDSQEENSSSRIAEEADRADIESELLVDERRDCTRAQCIVAREISGLIAGLLDWVLTEWLKEVMHVALLASSEGSGARDGATSSAELQ